MDMAVTTAVVMHVRGNDTEHNSTVRVSQCYLFGKLQNKGISVI